MNTAYTSSVPLVGIFPTVPSHSSAEPSSTSWNGKQVETRSAKSLMNDVLWDTAKKVAGWVGGVFVAIVVFAILLAVDVIAWPVTLPAKIIVFAILVFSGGSVGDAVYQIACHVNEFITERRSSEKKSDESKSPDVEVPKPTFRELGKAAPISQEAAPISEKPDPDSKSPNQSNEKKQGILEKQQVRRPQEDPPLHLKDSKLFYPQASFPENGHSQAFFRGNAKELLEERGAFRNDDHSKSGPAFDLTRAKTSFRLDYGRGINFSVVHGEHVDPWSIFIDGKGRITEPEKKEGLKKLQEEFEKYNWKEEEILYLLSFVGQFSLNALQRVLSSSKMTDREQCICLATTLDPIGDKEASLIKKEIETIKHLMGQEGSFISKEDLALLRKVRRELLNTGYVRPEMVISYRLDPEKKVFTVVYSVDRTRLGSLLTGYFDLGNREDGYPEKLALKAEFNLNSESPDFLEYSFSEKDFSEEQIKRAMIEAEMERNYPVNSEVVGGEDDLEGELTSSPDTELAISVSTISPDTELAISVSTISPDTELAISVSTTSPDTELAISVSTTSPDTVEGDLKKIIDPSTGKKLKILEVDSETDEMLVVELD